MSTAFLKSYDEYVLRATKDIVRSINMPIPTQQELITGVERRPIYPRGDISDSAVTEGTGEDLPDTSVPSAAIAPPLPPTARGAFHRVYARSGTGYMDYFVVGHTDPMGGDMAIPVGIPSGRVKGAKYLQKISKKGFAGTGLIY